MAERGERALFRRLRLRLTVVCTAVTGLILLAMACAALAVGRAQLTARAEAAFESEVNAICYHLRGQTVVDHTWIAQTEAGGLTLYLELSGAPVLYPPGQTDPERAALVALAREKALEAFAFDLSVPPDGAFQQERQMFQFQDGAGQRFRAAAVRIPQEQGWIGLLVLRSMAGEEREVLIQCAAVFSFAALALVMLAVFAWLFTRRAMRPLEESRRRQTEFIAAASHELRSPLAVIHASLSAAGDAPDEKRRHFLSLADGECMRMSRLVGDMLSLANADSGSWSICREETEPETLLLDSAEHFEGRAGEKGIRLLAELPEEPLPRCQWDRQRISQLLSILLDNAVSYTPPGGVIRLSARQEGNWIRLRVADTGPGIPDEEKARVFTRFYRADQARTGREHYGLGLCIALEIVQLHGGKIMVEDGETGGAVFSVWLPTE